MIGRLVWLLAMLVGASLFPAGAEPVAEGVPDCRLSAETHIEHNFPLPRVAAAIANRHLNILVVGAGSSQLPGTEGAKRAYPMWLQGALQQKLPGVDVRVVTDVKPKRTAREMMKSMAAALAANKPSLVVWQTGTVDAMQGVESDQFSRSLDKGIGIARSAGADVIFMNPQYSPRTESMIALGTYAENMRWVALQQDIPLFERFSIMKLWSDNGTFDLNSATKKLDMAERVHDCIGRLMADLVLESAKIGVPQKDSGR